MPKKFFSPKLVNGPAGDPALYVELLGEGQAILFDMGRLERLKPAELLRITHVFVSHTHFDHFIGFDHFLRLRLGHDKPVNFYGPEGFLSNVEGKLSGYTWNLVDGAAFEITAAEVRAGTLLRRRYRCSDAFRPRIPPVEENRPEGPLLAGKTFDVFSTVLDHRIPSLAFAVRERKRVNVDPASLESRGWADGPWVGELKLALEAGDSGPKTIEVEGKAWPVAKLKALFVVESPGETLAYVADARYNEGNVGKIVELAEGADHLFCEGGFLRVDEDVHYSPKYTDRFEALEREAQSAFLGDGDANAD
jgi:ribonuclease Z